MRRSLEANLPDHKNGKIIFKKQNKLPRGKPNHSSLPVERPGQTNQL